MHRLCLSLGCTLTELPERMSYREFLEWVAYYEVEPWGAEVDGKRMAVNTAQVLNAGLMMADPKRLSTKPFKHEDFYVGVRQPMPRKQTWQDQYKILSAISTPRVKK